MKQVRLISAALQRVLHAVIFTRSTLCEPHSSGMCQENVKKRRKKRKKKTTALISKLDVQKTMLVRRLLWPLSKWYNLSAPGSLIRLILLPWSPDTQTLMSAQNLYYPTPFKQRSPLFLTHFIPLPSPCPWFHFFPTPVYLFPAFFRVIVWDPSSPGLWREKISTHRGCVFWLHQGLKLNTTSALMRKIERLIIQTLRQNPRCSAEHGKLRHVWMAWTNLFTAPGNLSALGGFPLVSPRSDLCLSAQANTGPRRGGAHPGN